MYRTCIAHCTVYEYIRTCNSDLYRYDILTTICFIVKAVAREGCSRPSPTRNSCSPRQPSKFDKIDLTSKAFPRLSRVISTQIC